eukprot:TRINITY_DN22004_c0_g1_i1.p2 TRINITY_DN22004_c0_g1~~TRINITY_DN22004_c0_g1_i1.p2  ORF type:complete len:169 (+),score=43.68 TRINITY_DN22004_c0_g1_i1:54-560(+)
MRVLLALVAVWCCDAALPPGFDEELWCPPGACLRRREVPPGMVGPRTMYWECYGDEGTSMAQPWGVKVGKDKRAELLMNGWTMRVCEEQDLQAATGEGPRSPEGENVLQAMVEGLEAVKEFFAALELQPAEAERPGEYGPYLWATLGVGFAAYLIFDWVQNRNKPATR